MFHRWFLHHAHPAFAWGGEQPGPDADYAGDDWRQARGPQGGPPWGRGHRHDFRGPQGGPPWARGGHHGFGQGPGFGRGPWGGGRGPGFEEGPQGPQGGPPPWAHHWMRRGFPGGPGPGPGGPGGPGPRAFGRGDLKYQLLGLLTERPKHGYEMIKELEAQAGGFYTPSAGAVYPSLQLMEDRGWITNQTLDGKKVYTITDAGRAALAEHQQQHQQQGGRGGPHERPEGHGPWGGGRPGFGFFGGRGPFGRKGSPELHALGQESREVTMLLFNAVMSTQGDPAKLERLREIVASTRSNLEEFLGQQGSDTGPLPGDKARGPSDVL